MNDNYSPTAAQKLTSAYIEMGYNVRPVSNNGVMVLEIFRRSSLFKLGPIRIMRGKDGLVGKLIIKSSLEHERWRLASLPEETEGLLKVIRHYAPRFKATLSTTNDMS